MLLLRQLKLPVSLLFTLALVISFSARAETENLSSWKGEWVSAVSLLNTAQMDEELQPAYQEMGQKEGISATEWKTKKLARWNTAIKAVAIDDSSITFTLSDGRQVTGQYSYEGSETTQFGEHTLNWSKFSSNDEGVWQSVMLMEPEISEDNSGLTHFHFRYGNEGFAALQAADVFPTMVKPSTTAAQFAADFAE